MLRLKRYPKRGKNWYLRGSIRGQGVFETTGTDDRATAEAIRIKREAELLNRSIFGAGASVLFAEAAVSYLEGGGEGKYLGKCDENGEWSLIIGLLGKMLVGEIGQAEADTAAAMLYPNAGAATRKRHLYIPLCAVLNHAARKKWCSKPMIRHPSVPTPKTTFSSPTRLARLLPYCTSKNMRLFVTMLAYTGERLEKVVFMDWDRNIDLSRRTVTFEDTKNGEMRTVHIHDALLIELAKVPPEKRRGRVFHWKHKTAVHSPLASACRRAGIDYLPPHQQGRHTFGSWLRIYGKRDVKGIMEDGNWKDPRSVMRYLHVDPGESERSVASLPSVQIPCTQEIEAPKPLKRKRKSV